MPLIVYTWGRSPLPTPLLLLLEHLTGTPWQATAATHHTTYPRPGVPMCLHHHRWSLSATVRPGGGVLSIEEEEGHLNMSWSTTAARAITVELEDGRRLVAHPDPVGGVAQRLWAEGFTEAELLAAAAQVDGMRVQAAAGAG